METGRFPNAAACQVPHSRHESDDGVPGLHSRALAAIAKRESGAKRTKTGKRSTPSSRAAWGYESRAYPDVQQTADGCRAGRSFLSRAAAAVRVFRRAAAVRVLRPEAAAAGGVGDLFLAIFLVFSQIHPAFDITNPVIVLLAFIMLALSCIVIGLIAGKFEEQLKQMNQSSRAASTRPTSGACRSRSGRVQSGHLQHEAAQSPYLPDLRHAGSADVYGAFVYLRCADPALQSGSRAERSGARATTASMIRTAMWDPLQEPAYRTAGR